MFDENLMNVTASNTCSLSLQRYENLSGNCFKIVCSHGNIKYTDEQYAEAVASLTDNKFRMVRGTVKRYNAAQPHVSMLIEANTISKQYNEDNAKGLKVVNANVFLSEEDNKIWKKVGDGESARLVLSSNDDLESILKARRNRNITTASTMISDVHANVGDYVYFYNPSASSMQFGVKINDNVILERSSMTQYKVESSQIVEALCDEEFSGQVKAAVETQNLNRFIEYMRQLYGNHPEFFARWEELIKQRGSIGYEGNFNNTQAE